jgi:hypothetical protein
MRIAMAPDTHWSTAVVWVAATVAIGACVGVPTHSPLSLDSRQHANVSISVADSVVTFTRKQDFRWVDVSATVYNRGDRPLFIDFCYVDAQREIDGKRMTVWNPTCALGYLVPIQPGDSLLRTVRVQGSFAANDPLRVDPRLTAGKYRLTFPLSYETTNGSPVGQPRLTNLLSEDARSSSPFEIREP